MRVRRSTRLSAVVAALLVLLAAGAHHAPAAVATKTRCPKGTANEVIEAFATLFSRTDVSATTTVGDRAARLAGGDDPALRALLASWVADPAGRSSTVTALDVRCANRREAAVETELVLNGTPLPKVLTSGKAVREDGRWKVTRATFCARLTLENPDFASRGPCAAKR